jgi:hypothetical protein
MTDSSVSPSKDQPKGVLSYCVSARGLATRFHAVGKKGLSKQGKIIYGSPASYLRKLVRLTAVSELENVTGESRRFDVLRRSLDFDWPLATQS